MPWKANDAKHKTKKAKSKSEQKRWAATANAVLKKTGDDAKAIRIANASVKKKSKKK